MMFTVNPQSSHLDEGLLQAFHAALYEVSPGTPDAFVLRIGTVSTQARRLLQSCGVSSAAFLTAANPFSARCSDEDNAARNAMLQRMAEEAGMTVLPGNGHSIDNDWSEPSLFLIGISRERANRWADEFEQNAYVFVDESGLASLVLRR